MRRFVGLLVLVALLVGLVAVAGCAKKEGTVTTPEGDVKYESSDNSITVTSDGAETTWTVSTASEKALGVPVPSDATLEKGSVAVISSEAGNEKWSGATFWSKEDTDKVITWYREQLSGMTGFIDTSTDMDGVKIGLFEVKSGDTTKSVVVGAGQSGDPGKTKIVIANVTGAK